MHCFSCVLLILFPCQIFSANILVLDGLASPSLHFWMKTLCLELASRGHNVTSISSGVEDDVPENFHYLHLDQILSENENFDLLELGKLSVKEQLKGMMAWFMDSLNGIKKSVGYKQLLDYSDDFPFDLILYDYAAMPVLLPFASKFSKTPIVAITAYSKMSEVGPLTGLPFFTSFVPNVYQRIDSMTFYDRIQNVILTFYEFYLRDKMVVEMEKSIQIEFPKMKSLLDLERSIKLALVNYHPAIDPQQPISTGIIPIGGFHIENPKPLPENIENIIKTTKKGIVFFSLGSNVKSELLNVDRINTILKVFSEIKDYTFLWKMNDKGLNLKIPSNVVLSKWFPQNNILGHPKTKLFISHCGLLITQEATWHGVPILGMPVFLEQFTNMVHTKAWGMGVQILIEEVTAANFKEKILMILNNSTYTRGAQSRSRSFRDQPEHPRERAMWWIDYVLRNPDLDFLKSKSLELNMFQRESVDVYFVLFSVPLVLLYILKVSLTIVLQKLLRKSNTKLKSQ